MQKTGSKTKKYDEIWAVDAGRIESFFGELEETAGDVKVEALPERIVGTLALPQTRVVIEGDDADEIYRNFFLHFISAGG